MKVKRTDQEDAFKPIKLEIVLESENEARAIFNVFNHYDIVNYLHQHGVNGDEIQEALSEFHRIAHFKAFSDYLSKRIER